METLNVSERRWIWVYSISLALLCTLPYLIGFASEGSEWRFTGFIFAVEDGNSYIAKMLQGSYGNWLFRTPYTLMEQRGELVFLPYLLLGKLAAPPSLHEQLVAIFQLFRITATPLLVYSIYRFSSLFLPDPQSRRWVTVLATVGGGLGWLVPLAGGSSLFGSLPLDFISPETFGFLSVLSLPHLVLARALLFLALYGYLKSGTAGRSSWTPGLLLVALTLVQSLTVLSAYAVIGIHQVFILCTRGLHPSWRRVWLPAALRTLLPSLPIVLYYVIRFSSDPFLLAWTGQNLLRSPHPVHYVMAYGVFLLPVIVTLARAPWKAGSQWLLIAGWALAIPLLAYFPHNLQRRLVEGSWIALLILGAHWMSLLGSSPPRQRVARLAVSAFSVISPLLLFAGSLQVSRNPAQPAFIPVAEATAFEWMADQLAPGTKVLAGYDAGNAIPAWAPVQVVIGHGPESIGLSELRPQVEAFYAKTGSASERAIWLDQTGVQFLYVGIAEIQPLGWGPEAGLTPIYASDGIRIFEVMHDVEE